MTEKMLMLDIETTGIDPACEDLLQIGMLEMIWEKDHWRDGKSVCLYQFSNRAPISDFAREHQRDIYTACNGTIPVRPDEMRKRVLQFAEACGFNPPNLKFAGWNAAGFDIPFLVAKEILRPSKYKLAGGQEHRVGDFHYRIYDLQSALKFTMDLFDTDSKDKITELIKTLPENSIYHAAFPTGAAHDGLWDCANQLNFLNDLLALVRSRFKDGN
jgi:hypothetical protein